MMMSQILKSGFSQKHKNLDILGMKDFFFQIKKSLITHQGLLYWKK